MSRHDTTKKRRLVENELLRSKTNFEGLSHIILASQSSEAGSRLVRVAHWSKNNKLNVSLGKWSHKCYIKAKALDAS